MYRETRDFQRTRILLYLHSDIPIPRAIVAEARHNQQLGIEKFFNGHIDY